MAEDDEKPVAIDATANLIDALVRMAAVVEGGHDDWSVAFRTRGVVRTRAVLSRDDAVGWLGEGETAGEAVRNLAGAFLAGLGNAYTEATSLVREALDTARAAAVPPHAYRAGDAPGSCDECGLARDADCHVYGSR